MKTEERYVLEFIKDSLNKFKSKPCEIDNARYHHNTDYSLASSIVENGILSVFDLKNKGIKNYTSEFVNMMNDTESHINGSDGISLSVTGLTDLYSDEFEYNPYSELKVDFLVSSDIKAFRTTSHYGNEFISSKSIEQESIKAIDIRLLNLVNLIEQGKYNNINKLIENYNCLKDIALSLRQLNLNIPFREMSNNENNIMDINKIIKAPKILIK